MNAFGEVVAILLVTGVVALGHWWVSGKPVPEATVVVAGGAAVLKEGEVFLEDVLMNGGEGVLWVDARREEEWKNNGVPGSVHVSTLSQDGIGVQIEREVERFFGASKVVIYCSDAGCGLSHEVAKRMREYGDLVAGEIVVLHGGLEALAAAGMAGGQ